MDRGHALDTIGEARHDVSAGHFGDDQFGAGFRRIHAPVLQRIAKPWWRMIYQDDRRVMCECAHFRLQAESVGIRPTMVRIAGHEATVVTVPRSPTQIEIVPKPHLAHLLHPAATHHWPADKLMEGSCPRSGPNHTGAGIKHRSSTAVRAPTWPRPAWSPPESA